VVAETVESSLGWRVALSEVDGLVSVVSTGLLNTCCSCCVGALVDCRLHLLKELIDVHQIILSSKVGHRWESVLVLRHWTSVSSVAINRHQLGPSWKIFGKSSIVDALELHQSLANLVV
jgi:hypothetical protein